MSSPAGPAYPYPQKLPPSAVLDGEQEVISRYAAPYSADIWWHCTGVQDGGPAINHPGCDRYYFTFEDTSDGSMVDVSIDYDLQSGVWDYGSIHFSSTQSDPGHGGPGGSRRT